MCYHLAKKLLYKKLYKKATEMEIPWTNNWKMLSTQTARFMFDEKKFIWRNDCEDMSKNASH